MPWIIAETVCDEVSRFLGEPVPDRYIGWLDAKAERCYARHRHFRKLIRGRGNAPRDWLRAFMRHWLAALLDLERPDLYQCLPEDFNLGHRLPSGRHPLTRRKGCVPTLLPKPRPWDASRVLDHRHWAWLRSNAGGRSAADSAIHSYRGGAQRERVEARGQAEPTRR